MNNLLPSAAPVANAADEKEKERLRQRVDELQALADKQAQDLRRRNDELLDLQRNHEAFREKFILFREGMRTKNDETDAKFRSLQAELKASKDELATRQSTSGQEGEAQAADDEELRARLAEVQAEKDKLQQQHALLQEELAMARSAARAVQGHATGEASVVKDLRTRIENQAEYIRSQNAKMTEMEQKLVESQDVLRENVAVIEELKNAQKAHNRGETELSEQMEVHKKMASEAMSRVSDLQKKINEQEAEKARLKDEVDTQAKLYAKAVLEAKENLRLQKAVNTEEEEQLRSRLSSALQAGDKLKAELEAAKADAEGRTAAAAEEVRAAGTRASAAEEERRRLQAKLEQAEQQQTIAREQAQGALERCGRLTLELKEAMSKPTGDPNAPMEIESLKQQVVEHRQAADDSRIEAESARRRVEELELSLKQAREEVATQQRAQQHESSVFNESRMRAQQDAEAARARLRQARQEAADAQAQQHDAQARADELASARARAEEEAASLRQQLDAANDANQVTARIAAEQEKKIRGTGQQTQHLTDEISRLRGELDTKTAEAQSLNNALQSARDNARMYREHAMNQSSSEAQAAERRLEKSNERASQLEAQLTQANSNLAYLQQQLARGGLAGAGGAAGDGALRERLVRSRDVLLSKLIGNWQKQTLGRGFAAWLRSIEAFKMDRILMESDKYMSMDSSIDDLLNDALSKRRARSIVASSASLGGSSIDDDVLAAVNRPVSGGSVVSFGGSSLSGSLEWMV